MSKQFIRNPDTGNEAGIASSQPDQLSDALPPGNISRSAESTPYDELLSNCDRNEAALFEHIRRRILAVKAPQSALERLQHQLSQELEKLTQDKNIS